MSFKADIFRELKRLSGRGRCLHFDEGIRCNEIISAHSIQKQGQLRLLVEGSHVYRLSADGFTPDEHQAFYPKKIGIRRASTFPGFCKLHDNAIFKPIDERPLEPTHEQIALYSYRCLCRETFVKENAVQAFEFAKEHPALSPDARTHVESALLGQSLGYNGVRHHKALFESALISSAYEQFEFICFASKSQCSFQVSGLLYPNYDFGGRQLQDLSCQSSPLDLITCFTSPTPGGWTLTFAWHKSSRDTCIPFVQSLAEQVDRGRSLEDALFRFCITSCENHAIRISWWDSLTDAAKQQINKKIYVMAHPFIEVPLDYLYSGCDGIASWKFDDVITTLETVN